jgi:hypothetical protein
VLNAKSGSGYELFYAMKYPAPFLMIFPREAYFFVFRKPVISQSRPYRYTVIQTPYRLFTRTLDEKRYQDDLNQQVKSSALKISFRDERIFLGIFTQATAISIWES